MAIFNRGDCAARVAKPMSLQVCDLSILSYSNGFTMWLYNARTLGPDDIAQAGFFQEAGDMMSSGDLIVVTGAKGGGILCLRQDNSSLKAERLC